jgi:cell division protease FtsH
MTRAELDDRLVVLLAGRAAEQLACGDVSTGAESDLAQATELSRLMVTRYGMSERVGPRAVGRSDSLGEVGVVPWPLERTCSERVAVAVDEAIADALGHAEARATSLLARDRAALDKVATALVERETLHGDELAALLAGATLPPIALTRGAS